MFLVFSVKTLKIPKISVELQIYLNKNSTNKNSKKIKFIKKINL